MNGVLIVVGIFVVFALLNRAPPPSSVTGITPATPDLSQNQAPDNTFRDVTASMQVAFDGINKLANTFVQRN